MDKKEKKTTKTTGETNVSSQGEKQVRFCKNPTGYTNLAYSLGDRLTLGKDLQLTDQMKNDLLAKGFIEEI